MIALDVYQSLALEHLAMNCVEHTYSMQEEHEATANVYIQNKKMTHNVEL